MLSKNKAKNRIVIALICAALLIFLPGCALVSSNTQDLMSPPRTSEEQEGIYRLMRAGDDNVEFAYPKNGDYRSAIIMHDFSGDGVDDAIGFTKNSDGSGITVRFMVDSEQYGWKSVGLSENSASQVDRVVFGDVTGDGQDEIIIGWGSSQNMTATAVVYVFQRGKINEFPLGYSYSEMLLTDFTNDGVSEIFTATVYSQAKTTFADVNDAMARIYTFGGEYPYCAYSTTISNSIVNYTSVSFGEIDGGYHAVVLEGVSADNSTSSQILCLNSNMSSLITPMSVPSKISKYNNFNRPATIDVASQDVDGDGIIELPYVQLTAGHTKDKQHVSTSYLVSWIKYNPKENTATAVKYTVINNADGYMLTIPERYKDYVICYADDRLEELNFYAVAFDGDGRINISEKIFTIKKFTSEKWKEQHRLADNTYTLISLQGDGTVFAADIFTSNSSLAGIPLTFEDIK